MNGASSVIMRALHRFVVARPEARRFAARAWLGAPLVQAALATAGFGRTLRAITWLSEGEGEGGASTRPGRRRPQPVGPEEGAALVAAAFRLQIGQTGQTGQTGQGTCLPRALVQYALHLRDGVPARLVVGVRRPDDGRALAAHAWVEAAPEGERAGAMRPEPFTPLFVHGVHDLHGAGDQAS
jgi:hypothetical protein